MRQKEKFEYLDVDDLAKRWRVGKHWIYRHLEDRQIPNIRFGQKLRFPVHGIEIWEQSQTRSTQ